MARKGHILTGTYKGVSALRVLLNIIIATTIPIHMKAERAPLALSDMRSATKNTGQAFCLSGVSDASLS